MGRERVKHKHHCLTCTFEPNWKEGTFRTQYGVCRKPVIKKEYRPSALVMMTLIVGSRTRDGKYENFVYGLANNRSVEIDDCPVWEQKIKKEENNGS